MTIKPYLYSAIAIEKKKATTRDFILIEERNI